MSFADSWYRASCALLLLTLHFSMFSFYLPLSFSLSLLLSLSLSLSLFISPPLFLSVVARHMSSDALYQIFSSWSSLLFHTISFHSSYKIHQLFTDYLLRLPSSELLEKHLFRSRANRRLVFLRMLLAGKAWDHLPGTQLGSAVGGLDPTGWGTSQVVLPWAQAEWSDEKSDEKVTDFAIQKRWEPKMKWSKNHISIYFHHISPAKSHVFLDMRFLSWAERDVRIVDVDMFQMETTFQSCLVANQMWHAAWIFGCDWMWIREKRRGVDPHGLVCGFLYFLPWFFLGKYGEWDSSRISNMWFRHSIFEAWRSSWQIRDHRLAVQCTKIRGMRIHGETPPSAVSPKERTVTGDSGWAPF